MKPTPSLCHEAFVSEMPSLGLELFIYLMALQNQLTLKEGKPSVLHPRGQHPQPGALEGQPYFSRSAGQSGKRTEAWRMALGKGGCSLQIVSDPGHMGYFQTNRGVTIWMTSEKLLYSS